MKTIILLSTLFLSANSFSQVPLTETFTVNIDPNDKKWADASMITDYFLILESTTSDMQYQILCPTDAEGFFSEFGTKKDGVTKEKVTGFYFEKRYDCLYAINAIRKMNSALGYEIFEIKVDSAKSKFLEINAIAK